MRPHHLKSRGFNRFGKWVEVDFSSLPPGKYAIMGENGAGKTTFMDLFTVGALYREFPSRKPKHSIANATDDGELEFQFDANGHRYRSTLKVRKRTQSAILERLDGDEWTPMNNAKSLGDYDAAIAGVVATRDMFMSVAYAAQSNDRSFASLSQPERKALFAQMLGLEGNDRLLRSVRERMARIDVAEAARLASEIEANEAQLDKDVALIARSEEKLKANAEAEAVARDRLAEAMESSGLRTKAERLKSLLSGLDSAEREKGQCETDLAALAGAKSDVGDLDGTALSEATDERDKCRSAVRVAEQEVRQASSLLRDIDRAEELLKEVPCGDNYPFCRYIKDSHALRERRDLTNEQYEESREKAKAASVALEAAEERHAQAKAAYDAAVAVQREERARADKRARLEARITELNGRISDAVAEAEALAAEVPLTGDGDIDWSAIGGGDRAAIERDLRRLADEKDGLHAVLRKTESSAGALRERIVQATRRKAAIAEDATILRPLKMLEAALGPSGYQMSEIEAAGPEVTEIVNALLDEFIGDKFKVTIGTLVPKADGKGYKEDFDFRVYDVRTGGILDMRQLSGGEQAMIHEATRIALAIFHSRRSASHLDIIARDEPSSALSDENARHYVAMLEKARRMAGVERVFFITHSASAGEAADGMFYVADGKVTLKRRSSDDD